MLNRKSVVAAVAALSLGFGTLCPLARADNTAQDKQTQDKNPAAVPDKNQTESAAPGAPVSQQQMDDLKKQEQEQDKMTSDLMSHFNDADFAKVASMANQDEIQAARQALTKTNSQDVKNFAQRMIKDHTKAGDELKSIAQQKDWKISDQPDAKHMIAMMGMDTMDPADFDKAYASSAVADHEEAIKLFKLAADKASDTDLKEFASKEIPVFEMHLKMAQDLEGKVAAVTMAK